MFWCVVRWPLGQLVAIFVLGCGSTGGRLIAKDGQPENLWIATISVEQYQHLPDKAQLNFCDDDANSFVERMRRNRRTCEDQILTMHRGSNDSKRYPTQQNIQRELPEFLSRANENDAVVVFAAMHGIQWKDPNSNLPGRTYLLPTDADPNHMPETLIDIEWLREQLLGSTRARTVVLFLDACHSGGIAEIGKNEHFKSITSRGVESVFKAKPQTDPRRSIYVLSSCRGEESSVEWDEFNHGVFTHWLVHGLDGAADVNGDAIVTMDELFQFVELQVPKTVSYLSKKMKKPISQNPQRFFCGTDHGDPKLFPVTPMEANACLQRLSHLIDGMLRNHSFDLQGDKGTAKVSVLEFGSITEGGKKELRGNLGSFGAVSRDLVERGLTDLTGKSRSLPAYRVVPEDVVKASFRDIKLETILQGTSSLSSSGTDASSTGVDAVVIGTYVRRGNGRYDPGPDRLQLEIQLFDLNRKEIISRINQTVLINEELWSMLGGSKDERQSLVRVERVERIEPKQIDIDLYVNEKVDDWNQKAKLTNPLFPSSQPSTLSVNVHQRRPGHGLEQLRWLPVDQNAPNLLAFETTKGSELEMVLTNRTDEWISVIVQIDGLNQIGRQPSLPSKSPNWICPPRGTFRIDQWLDSPSAPSSANSMTQELKGNKLVVSDPPSSLAGQQGFFDQLGEIRILVYSTKSKGSTRGSGTSSPAIGIAQGQRMNNVFPINQVQEIDIRKNLATYVIRYKEAR